MSVFILIILNNRAKAVKSQSKNICSGIKYGKINQSQVVQFGKKRAFGLSTADCHLYLCPLKYEKNLTDQYT
jgi:hypothetical protein